MMTDAPRAYLHEPCGILATAQWWRDHHGVCSGCETTEGWSSLFSDTAPDLPDALDSLPIAALLHSRLVSWFGDDRQSFLTADLVPVVTQLIAEAQYNAVDMARKADIAERRAEEAEYHVEQLRDARDRAEQRIERAEDEVERLRDALLQVRRVFDLQCPPMLPEKYVDRGAWMAHSWWNTVLGSILNRGRVGTGAGEGATGQDTGTAWVTRSTDCPEAPAQAHPPACNCVPGVCTEGDECCESHECPGFGCDHEWLDRPESDTRECLICGTEATA